MPAEPVSELGLAPCVVSVLPNLCLPRATGDPEAG